jgi:pimeloyl-ACP methyl ester carboxylesterase
MTQRIKYEQVKIKVSNFIFDCRVSGNSSDELVILLHGFPETSFMYEPLIKDLSSLGYYCIAPNLRGYSGGARPKGKRNYTLDKLVEDVMAIAKTTGKEKFHLIGHDWGAAIGWHIAHDHEASLLSWTALSVPHTQSFFNAILYDKEQRKKSYYMWLFQLPLLPELSLKFMNMRVLRKLWTEHSPQEVEDYIRILKEKGALSASLHYYRANFKLKKRAKKGTLLGDIDVPTLYLWGKEDLAVGYAGANNCYKHIKGDYTFLALDSDHWLVQRSYTQVKTAISAHLYKNSLQYS